MSEEQIAVSLKLWAVLLNIHSFGLQRWPNAGKLLEKHDWEKYPGLLNLTFY